MALYLNNTIYLHCKIAQKYFKYSAKQQILMTVFCSTAYTIQWKISHTMEKILLYLRVRDKFKAIQLFLSNQINYMLKYLRFSMDQIALAQ